MRFKSDRIEKEWGSGKLDKRLQFIVIFLDWYCRNFVTRIDGTKQDIQVTCIYRTPQENLAIYKGDKKQADKSPHPYWRGVDIGVNAFSLDTRAQLRDLINKHFKNIGKAKVCVWHNVGLGDHFHIQVGSGQYSYIYK